MIKEITKQTLINIGKCVKAARLHHLAALYHFARNYIYTGIHKSSFKSFGNSFIQYSLYSLRGANKISIGDGCVIEDGMQLEAWGNNSKITIGNGCLFRRNNHITAIGSITIGDGLLTGDNVLISDNSHGDSSLESLQMPPREREIKTKGGIQIGKNVWLGNNVCILSSVNIGDGVVVGANSVVTHDIPSYSIAAGSPAKIIKTIK